jgi:lysophospholipase L1-like esterase
MRHILIVAAIFLGLASHLRAEEIPNTAIIPAPACEKDFYNWTERHDAVCAAIREKPVKLVFVGDSITHLWGGTPTPNKQSGDKVWQEFYSPRNAINMGFGWDRTQQALWRIENGEFEGITPEVAVVLIGTNNLTGHNVRENTDPEIVAGITAVCSIIRKKSPQTKVLLLGLLPRGAEPLGTHRTRIRAINTELAKLNGKDGVTYLDIGPKLLDLDGKFLAGVAPDNLHLSESGYRIWAEAMEPTLKKLLGETQDDSLK